ncbi:MAG: (d)CMP kinase [Candidatus Methylomirabilales bacterium]
MSRIPKNLVITIDGPVGAGKSTTAQLLAKRLGYCHIETGAMYRAVAWKAIEQEVDLADPDALMHLIRQTRLELKPGDEGLRVVVDGEDVSDVLRSPQIGAAASVLSIHPPVREELVRRQRELGARGGVVMDGRDIGTVVFPDAPVKFYLIATLEERGRRRFLQSPPDEGGEENTLKQIQNRDRRDTERDASPLKPAPDAILIDTTSLSPEEVVSEMERHIGGKFR